MRLIYSLAILLFTFFAGLARADVRTDRWAAVGKLWFTVKYFHPYLSQRDIDWEKAFVDAYPAIAKAEDTQAYGDAVEGMLRTLDDPATRVEVQTASNHTSINSRRLFETELKDSTLYIRISNLAAAANFNIKQQQAEELCQQIDNAASIVFDLRVPAPQAGQGGRLEDIFSDTSLQLHLFSGVLPMPASASLFHQGLKAESENLGNYYFSGAMIRSASVLQSADSAKAHRIVFLANSNTILPSVAVSLQHAGKAYVFSETKQLNSSLAEPFSIALGEGLNAKVRMNQTIFADGSGELPPTKVVGAGQIVAAAMEAVAQRFSRPPKPATVIFVPVERADHFDAGVPLPEAPYRLIAAFKIWGVFQHFFAYRQLMHEDWTAVLREFIPKLENAQTVRDYNFAVAEMGTRAHDAHVFVFSPFMMKARATTLVQVDWVENQPVITKVFDQTAAAAGAQVGDIIESVDGDAPAERMAQKGKILSISVDPELKENEAFRILDGDDSSSAIVLVQHPDGSRAEIKLARSIAFRPRKRHFREGDVVRILPGNIGYVDLDRLEGDQVDDMFEQLKGTRAIVFDMRGYPNDTAPQIAPRLGDKNEPEAASFISPWSYGPDLEETSESGSVSFRFQQRIPAATGPRYHGRTVMLIDGSTLSQAEHAGLYFKAANDTRFVGSPSAGTNGTVSSFVIPGGISIRFTGEEVRHSDGRQLQRVGLQPDLVVRPTIAGIRAGKDEVLDAAIGYLTK